MKLVYYSQEDPRWKGLLYSNHQDPKQNIAASGCGPTSFAMAASSLLGRQILPPETCKYAVDHGFRTRDSGTAWGYFASIAKVYGLECKQVANIVLVRDALRSGALVVASMARGNFTRGGHYVLLAGINGDMVDVFDPNPDNRSYTGVIDQGVRNDGMVSTKLAVVANEARQFWVITSGEEDQPMTKDEKKAFDALAQRVEKLERKVQETAAPDWFIKEFGSGDLGGIINEPTGTDDFWRTIAVTLRAVKGK